MAEAPRDFKAGRPLREELTAARLNAILAAIRRNKPVAGRGIGVYETGAGTRIDLIEGTRRGGSLRPRHPFQVFEVPPDLPSQKKVRVLYGTINGAAPTGMSVGDDPPYTLTLPSATGRIWIGVTLSETTHAVTSRFIDLGADLPADEDYLAHYEIASWTITEGKLSIAQSVTSSLGIVRAGFIFVWGAT